MNDRRPIVIGAVLGCLPWTVLGLIFLIWIISALTGRPGGDRVGLIHISGVITGAESGASLLGGGGTTSEEVIRQIRKAEDDPGVKAIVLRINSPGGAAAGSQEIYQEVLRLRRDSRKKVFVSMGDVAASGGYYVASAADRVFANGATLTGSIGVISTFPKADELMRKLGVDMRVVKSGKFKDSGSLFRPMSEEERALFQKMVMAIYNQFVDAVAAGRRMDRTRVLALADGRVYTGADAKRLGLVDELGNLRDAIRAAGRAAGIKGEPETRDFGRRGLLSTLFGEGETVIPQHLPGAELLLDPRLTSRFLRLVDTQGLP